MRVFLAAHRSGGAAAGIEQAGFLYHRAAAFDQINLATGFMFHRLHDEAHAVHVLGFGAGAKGLAGLAHRYVHIGPHGAFVHIAIATADIAQQLAQAGHIGAGFGWRANIGPRHDLHQRAPAAVEINIGHRRMQIMDRFAGVLLQMNALDTDALLSAIVQFDVQMAFAHDRVIELADLVTLRQIGVEIILAIKARPFVDLCIDGEARPHRLAHAFAVDYRQHARHRGIDQAHLRIGFGTKFGAGA